MPVEQGRLRELGRQAADKADVYINQGMDPQAAIRRAAEELGISLNLTEFGNMSPARQGTPIEPGVGIQGDDPNLGRGDVEFPPAPVPQGEGGRGGILQALAAAAQRPPVEAPTTEAPDPRLRIIQALSSAGSGLLGLRDQAGAEKRNRAAQATANVVNALSKGRAGARATQEEARPGLLTRLAAIPGQAAGAGLQIQADQQAADQQTFENQRKVRGLEFEELGAESERVRAEASLLRAQRTKTKAPNELFTQQGIDYFNEGLSREQATEKLWQDPDLAAMLAENPDLLGRMLRGHEAARTGKTAEALAAARDIRAETTLTDRQTSDLLTGFSDQLQGQARRAAVTGGAPIFEDARSFQRAWGDKLANLDSNAMERALGSYEIAAATYWENRTEQMEKARVAARQKTQDAIRAEKGNFEKEEALRKSLQNLPGVKAFSGTQGIGGAFARMDDLYQTYASDRDAPGARGAFQNAIVQNFQRMIDPATVRLGDIQLIVDSQSMYQRFTTAIKRAAEGGFVSDDLLDQMHQVAARLSDAQRGFVQEEVAGAITVWNTIHTLDLISPKASETIAEGILGGNFSGIDDVEGSAEDFE